MPLLLDWSSSPKQGSNGISLKGGSLAVLIKRIFSGFFHVHFAKRAGKVKLTDACPGLDPERYI